MRWIAQQNSYFDLSEKLVVDLILCKNIGKKSEVSSPFTMDVPGHMTWYQLLLYLSDEQLRVSEQTVIWDDGMTA